MDNYKIKVKDEAESKEAQELFVHLGYELDSFFGNYESSTKWVLACTDGSMGCASDGMAKDTLKEITFPQLRDLVVLKRNDVKDANYRSKKVSDGLYFKSCDGIFYFMFEGKWVQSEVNTDEGLEPVIQDPALISGAEALRALADGKEVEFQQNENWYSLIYSNVHVKCVLNDSYKLRLKPQTIKVELEIPAPYKAKIGGRDDTSFVLNVGRHQYCYKNEEDYTKARDALEAVFDSAVRGTNS